MKYYIIGGGLAGLRIANLLTAGGEEVEILESTDAVGGLMKTEKRDGFLFDIGPHIFFKEYAPVYRSLIGAELHNIKALYGVGFKGKDIISPIRPANILKNLGLAGSLPIVIDVLRHKFMKGSKIGDIDNAEKWVIANFGPMVYKCFFKDYIPKVMGVPAARVTEDWGTERRKFYKEHNLWSKSSKFILDLFLNKKNKGGFLDVFYPEEGAQQIPLALYEEVIKAGGKVRLNTTVEKIKLREGRVKSLAVKTGSSREEIALEADSFVISTMPITNLIESMSPARGNLADVKRGVSGLRYRSLLLFNMIIKRDRLKDKAQIYFPEAKYNFKRVYEPKNLQDMRVNRGKTGICVEVCYNEEGTRGSVNKKGIYQEVLAGLEDFYGVGEKDVLEMWTKQVPYSYSIYELGYRDRLAASAEYLFEIENIVSFGRQGSFRYNHMTNSVMDSSKELYDFLSSGRTKKEFLNSPGLKKDFF